MSLESKQDIKAQRPFTTQDTLLKYNKAKRIIPEKKEFTSPYAQIIGEKRLPEKEKSKTTEEVLDTIFPPRYYEKDGKPYKQEVDRAPAYHWDVKELNQLLNYRLKEHGTNFMGLCPVRESLFEQCFDEILRQVTVNMSERGLLLKRIRDEIKMTLVDYHSMYLSATKYAIRKALMIAKQQFDLEMTIKKLSQMKEAQELYIAGLLADEEREEMEEREMRETTAKEHATECFLLRKKCHVLEAQIRTKVIARALKKKEKLKANVKNYKNKLFKS